MASIACAIDVEVSLAFGDGTTKWPIAPADFRLVALDEETCVGAFFQLPPGTAGPDWIVGDTFLVRSESLSPPELLVNQLR